jgi:F-type H+-transporting ATPase subunit b
MRWFVVQYAFLAILLAAFLAPAPVALAAAAADPHEHAPAKAEGDKHAHPEKKGGLDFLQLERYDLGIFTLIVFGLLVIILSKTAFPKISEGLAKREASIASAKDEAMAAKKEAEELRITLQKEHAAANDQIRSLLEEARRDAEKLRSEQREAGVKDAQAERERAKREIESAKDAALNDIYKQAVNLAAMISAKTLSRQISAEDHGKLLDESLAELKQAASKA